MNAKTASKKLREMATQLNIIPSSEVGQALTLALECLEDYAKQEIKENEQYRGDNEYW